jgi:methylenetetrahydrofolate--tRNA-(uracil-5-)-methyltransferase
MKLHPHVLVAGQIAGVEGYVESMGSGLMAGLHAAALARGAEPLPAPPVTALGSLVRYITQADSRNFQPANITFDLLPPLEQRVRDRQMRHRRQCERALSQVEVWLSELERRFLPQRAEAPGRIGPARAGVQFHR